MASSETTFIKLVARDKSTFVLERKVCLVSQMLRAMLTSPTWSTDTVELPEIDGPILELACQYMHYKLKYASSTSPIPEFPIKPEHALDLLVAANYLDM